MRMPAEMMIDVTMDLCHPAITTRPMTSNNTIPIVNVARSDINRLHPVIRKITMEAMAREMYMLCLYDLSSAA